MADEILYCARCHRVILPREIKEGKHHFVDGDAVCQQCFTRLSKRLRPVSGVRAESRAQPVPVDISESLKKPKPPAAPAPAAGPAPRARRERPSSARHVAARTYGKPQVVFMACCFALGLGAGAAAYLAHPLAGAKPGPRPAPTEEPGEKPPLDPEAPPEPGENAPPAENPAEDSGPLKPSADGTVRLPPVADAFVTAGAGANRKFGGERVLTVGRDAEGNQQYAYLRFDLSRVRGEFASAELHLQVQGVGGIRGLRQEAGLVADHTWEEGDVSWASRPAAGKVLATWMLGLSSKSVEIDLTEAVKSALAGDRKLSLRLGVAEGARSFGYIRYYSRERPPDQRPYLVLSTRAGEPDPLEAPEPAEKPQPGSPARNPEATIRLPPTDDAFVVEKADLRDKHFGAAGRIRIHHQAGNRNISYMMFDLSSVKAPVTSAKLRLHRRGRSAPKDDIKVELHLVASHDWNERTITWNNMPPPGELIGSWDAKTQEVLIDVTRQVVAALPGDKKLAVRIAPAETTARNAQHIGYGSKEGKGDQRPELVIETGRDYRPGLKAEFFKLNSTPEKLPDLSGMTPKVARIDSQVNYPSTVNAWQGLDFEDNFASRHTGHLKVEKPGRYTLYLESDDGAKLWLNGALLIDNDQQHGMQGKSATVTLKAGYHALRVEFFDGTVNAGLILSYAGPGIAKRVVPADKLFHQGRGK